MAHVPGSLSHERKLESSAAYRAAHREQHRDYVRKWYLENRVRLLAKAQIYRKKNRAAVLEAQRRCYDEKRDEINADRRRLYKCDQQHRDNIRARTRAFYIANHEQLKAQKRTKRVLELADSRARNKSYYAANSKRLCAQARERYAQDPEYRARKLALNKMYSDRKKNRGKRG